METTSNSEIFETGVTKTKDGRTRKERNVEGDIANISDTPSGVEIKNEPGTGLIG